LLYPQAGPNACLQLFSRNQGSNKSENEQEKYVRLFIVIPKTATEEDIREEFSQWGEVEHVTIVKEKNSGSPKGFGYVRFNKCVANAALLSLQA